MQPACPALSFSQSLLYPKSGTVVSLLYPKSGTVVRYSQRINSSEADYEELKLVHIYLQAQTSI